MKQFINYLGYALVYGSIFLLSIFPLSVLYILSDFLFFIIYYLVGYRRAVVVQNLSRAFPEKRYSEIDRINKAFYRIFIGYFAEILKMFSASHGQMQRHIHFKNIHIIDEYTRKGKNVIIALGHCGNWEMLNITPMAIKSEIYAAYKPLKNKIFDQLMIRMRSRYGIIPIPSETVAKHFLNKNNRPAAYLFLADQCPRTTSKENKFTFLNQETGMYKGIEKLAQKTNAAVVFFHINCQERGNYQIECIPICENPRTDKIEIIPAYIQLLEENIKEEPHSWLWSHKRWKR